MSERSSLFASIVISKEARDRFLISKAAHPIEFKDWLDWLNKQAMTGRITEQDISLINQGGLSTRDYLDAWLKAPYSFGFEQYNQANGLWLISMLEFSENYMEYIRFLSVLRNVHNYIDNDDESTILVHSFLWGDTDSDFLIEVSPSHKIITQNLSDSVMNQAIDHLEARRNTIFEQYKD